MAHLLVFGPGYTATPVMERAQAEGWDVSATYRTPEKKEDLEHKSIAAISFEDTEFKCPENTHLLITPAPKNGCPILKVWGSWVKQQKHVKSISYLSSTNVYGDHGGNWVDETTPTTPSLKRGQSRLEAEENWSNLADAVEARIGLFRLAGIYGPNRNALMSLKTGKARRVIKEGQVFSRIHVADICEAIWAFMNDDTASGAFNLADDEPCAPHLVIEEAANMLGISPPPLEDFETAEMSEMARSFYMESKRVKNDKVKALLGHGLHYPNYKVGLRELLKQLPD